MENNWIETQLEELLLSLESGSRPKGGVRGIIEGIPSVGGEHLHDNGKFNFSNIKFVPKQFALKMKRGQIKTGDILIVKDGATTGRTSYVNGNFPYQDAVVNEHVFICRTSSELNSKYLFYFLWSREGKEKILENFKGSAQGGINTSFVLNTFIPLAPIHEQERIVSKLDAIMQKVESNKQRLETVPKLLKRFKQSVLADAMNGKLTEKWRESNDKIDKAEILLSNLSKVRFDKYKKECAEAAKHKTRKPQFPRGINDAIEYEILEPYEIPDTWSWTVVDKMSTVALGGTPSRKEDSYWNGNINWVSSGEVANNRILDTVEKITGEGLSNSNTKIYPKGTVLLAMIGEGKTRGQVSILNIEATTNQNVAGLLLSNDFICSEYVWYFLLSRYESLRTDGLGGAQPALNSERVGQIFIAIPPLEEQKEIVKQVEKLFAFSEKLEARYTKAKTMIDKLPQSILAKAFRGELVPQNPNDEPASVLLGRIRKEKEKLQAEKNGRKTKEYSIEEKPLKVATEKKV